MALPLKPNKVQNLCRGCLLLPPRAYPQNKLRSLNALEVFFAEDNAQRLSNLHKIQQLAQSEPSIEIFSHDPVELSYYQSLIL